MLCARACARARCGQTPSFVRARLRARSVENTQVFVRARCARALCGQHSGVCARALRARVFFFLFFLFPFLFLLFVRVCVCVCFGGVCVLFVLFFVVGVSGVPFSDLVFNVCARLRARARCAHTIFILCARAYARAIC